MGRPLGILEQAEALTNEHYPFNVVSVLRLSAAPSPDTLRRAFALLRRRHPLLNARIRRLRGRPVFDSEDVPDTPWRILPRDSAEAWQGFAEDELNTPFDLETGPLVRLAFLGPTGAEGEAELVLCLQHVIVDGVSMLRLVRDLLDLCARLETGGGAVELPALPLLPPAESRIPAAFRGWRGARRLAGFLGRQMADEALVQWRSRDGRRSPVHSAGRARILPLQLSAPATEALVRACRRHRVTLNSALSAALLRVALRRLYPGEQRPLRHFVIANLRPYLVPPLEEQHLGSYFAMLRITAQPSRQGGFWELAAAVNRQIQALGKRGDKYLNLLMTRALMKTMLTHKPMRMGHTALSYAGALNLPQRWGSTRLRGLHGFISNFPIGPEYTAQVSLFEGRLWWDIVYLDCDMDEQLARDLAQSMFGELEEQAHAGRD